MLRVWFACAGLLLLSACATPSYSAKDDPDSPWTLVFQDEFSGKGRPDPEKWISKEYNRRPNPNGPDGWWLAENAYLSGKGQLVLRANLIKNNNPDEDDDPYDFATGMVSTEGIFEPRYGRFEARIKLQEKSGWWSAFWLFTKGTNKVDGSGKDGTEIDIFEGFAFTDSINQALHWDGYGKEHQTVGRRVKARGLKSGWHTMTLEWNKDGYVFFVDGTETWRTHAGGVSETPSWIKLSGELSTLSWATNRYWAGSVNPRSYPDYFKVDWVRVYTWDPANECGEPCVNESVAIARPSTG